MVKISREKIALVIFFALFIIGGVLLFSYFFTGKSWSVAASIVDDAAGSMEDYSVVVFAGTALPEQDKGSSGSSEQSGNSTSMKDALEDTPNNSKTPDITEKILDTFNRADKAQSMLSDRIYVSDVRDLYELKGASAMSLYLGDLQYYSDPTVYKVGSKKIGIFSATEYFSRAKIKSITTDFKQKGCNAVICISDKESNLPTFDGINVFIYTGDGDAPASGGGTICMKNPTVGSVGTVIISSNNVITSKLITKI